MPAPPSPLPGSPGGELAAYDPGAPLYARAERRIPRLARAMIETFVAEVPIYSRLPREQLDGEITTITEDNLRTFFRALREGRSPDDEELAEPRSSAARRAQERVPLDAVLTAYHIGTRMCWQALVAEAGPDDLPALLAAGERVMLYLQSVTAAVSTAYLEEQQAIHGEERDARRAFASALLNGEPVTALAGRLGVTVAPAYVVLALAVGQHPDEQDVGVVGAVAARRKLRRLQERLDAFAGEPVLGLLDPGGGLVLVPTLPGKLDDTIAALPGVVADVAVAAGADVTAGAAGCAGLDGLVRVGRQAKDVLGLALRMGRPPGLYLISDVLLEYQLTRDSDALPLLAGLLDPLSRNPDLVLTLETYLANDLDRRGTATSLHVHPNTLDYRLHRIAELTGLDPSSPTGLHLLAAGLTARTLVDRG